MTRTVARLRTLLCCSVCACGGGGGGQGTGDGGAGNGDAPMGTATVRDKARALAQHLRGNSNFMMGFGNDNSGPYERNIAIDLHYQYLVGYGDTGGWPTWNDGGMYPAFFASAAKDNGATPMYVYYQLALELEQGNDAVLADTGRMEQYLLDMRLLFTRLAEAGGPAALVLEPDFFGYLMQRAVGGTGPDALVARTHHVSAPECSDLPETAAGLTRCIVAIARAVNPDVRIGFHASAWGSYWDPLDADAPIEARAADVANFLLSVGAAETDFVAVETLDRDAGFWETSGGGPTCSTTMGSRGAVYWDESNETLPNFNQHLRWVRALTDGLTLPALWWQTPLGVPSDTCGGSDESWRDNRVRYFFEHVDELAAAGGAGATFGTGAGGQTNLATDSDQFKNAMANYVLNPLPL